MTHDSDNVDSRYENTQTQGEEREQRGDRGNRGYDRRGSRDVPRVTSERLSITSGDLIILDQYMLGNSQFHEALSGCQDVSGIAKVIENFGGVLFPLTTGDYRVYRDVQNLVIAIQSADFGVLEDLRNYASENSEVEAIGHVFVDTRCVVFLDLALLQNQDLIGEYRKLRNSGDEKPARDLLRENGAAVRYGFQKYGDELSVIRFPEDGTICLWPDTVNAG